MLKLITNPKIHKKVGLEGNIAIWPSSLEIRRFVEMSQIRRYHLLALVSNLKLKTEISHSRGNIKNRKVRYRGEHKFGKCSSCGIFH